MLNQEDFAFQWFGLVPILEIAQNALHSSSYKAFYVLLTHSSADVHGAGIKWMKPHGTPLQTRFEGSQLQ